MSTPHEPMSQPTRPAAAQPASGGVGAGAPYRYPVRRGVNVRGFLIAGGLLGALVGVLIDVFGPDSRCPQGATNCAVGYEPGASLMYMLVLGILAGIAVGATVAVLVDRALQRR